MDDTKLKEEQNEPKKPVGEQITDFVALEQARWLKPPSNQLRSVCAKRLQRRRQNR